MTRNYLISLAAAKVKGWAEYLQRPSNTAHPLTFLGADAIWSQCKRAVVDYELAQVEPIVREQPVRMRAVQKPKRDTKTIMDELGY